MGNALLPLGLATSGRTQALVGRIHNAFAHPSRISEDAPPCPDRDESQVEHKKRLAATMAPSIQEAKRVAGYAGEYAANCLIVVDGELEVTDYPADSKDMQADCDDSASAWRQINPREAFRFSCHRQPNLKWIDPADAAASLRDWAARPARV